MPIYEYRCEQGHTFDVMQRMSDDPVETCITCERPVQRVFRPVAIHFKGSGFHNTDYGKAKRGGSSEGESADGGGDKAEKGADKKTGDAGGGSGDSKGSSDKGSSDSKGGDSKSGGDTSTKATSGSSSSA